MEEATQFRLSAKTGFSRRSCQRCSTRSSCGCSLVRGKLFHTPVPNFWLLSWRERCDLSWLQRLPWSLAPVSDFRVGIPKKGRSPIASMSSSSNLVMTTSPNARQRARNWRPLASQPSRLCGGRRPPVPTWRSGGAQNGLTRRSTTDSRRKPKRYAELVGPEFTFTTRRSRRTAAFFSREETAARYASSRSSPESWSGN